MGLLDNDTVIVDAILTKKGRQKLANGQPLGITQYAFGDTGVDYTLYNPSHPSGSDSYGSAITSLPMLEAVPNENVFMRFSLYGEGERNVQSFASIQVENASTTISKKPNAAESNPINIIPNVNPDADNALFTFKVLDFRGLTSTNTVSSLSEPDFPNNVVPGNHPDPIIATFSNIPQLNLNASPAQISTGKVIGVEITRDGTAPAFVSVTIEQNNIQ
jgi:hypothetical protein